MARAQWRKEAADAAGCVRADACEVRGCGVPPVSLLRHYGSRRRGVNDTAVWLCARHTATDHGLLSPYAPEEPDAVFSLYHSSPSCPSGVWVDDADGLWYRRSVWMWVHLLYGLIDTRAGVGGNDRA